MAINRSKSDTKRSEQNVLVDSYDEDYSQLAVGVLGSDGNALYYLKTNADGELIVSTSGGEQALQLDDTSTVDTTYIGYAAIATLTSAASWQIMKLDDSSGLAITWADGNDSYDNEWDDRTSLTYE